MFTVEMEHDEVCITVVDDTGENQDLIINAFDDVVYIRQPDDDDDYLMHTIVISPEQWEDLIASLKTPEGAYIVR